MARMYAGCWAPKDEIGAAYFWMRLVDSSIPGYIPNVSRSIRARAYSCLAKLYQDHLVVDGNGWDIAALYRAGKAADECAALGLLTAIVINVGDTIEMVGFRRKEDSKFPEWDTTRFEELTNLWEMYDRRNAEVKKRLQQVADKMAKNPIAYRCAAPDCGIQATKKSGLMQCSGPCTLDRKPAYCSKECQRLVSGNIIYHWPWHMRKLHFRIGGGTNHFARR